MAPSLGCLGFSGDAGSAAEEESVSTNEQGLDGAYRGYLSVLGAGDAAVGDVCTTGIAQESLSCMSPLPSGKYKAAVRFKPFYAADATMCGVCVRLIGEKQVTTTVEIADHCPACERDAKDWGRFDVSCELMQELKQKGAVRFDEERKVYPVQWQFVPCNPPGALSYRFKSDSNPLWLAVQAAQHRSKVAGIALRSRADGRLIEASYLDDNGFWVFNGNSGAGPFDVIVTNDVGKRLEDEEVFSFQGDALHALGGREVKSEIVSVEDGKGITTIDGRIQL